MSFALVSMAVLLLCLLERGSFKVHDHSLRQADVEFETDQALAKPNPLPRHGENLTLKPALEPIGGVEAP
ncbi:hypothetical protein [Roseibium aquae]|uniref:hypothetical protein n=1 Tax=Roseibium aquae TaxID=1323746 RepID=UPI00123DE056|nr:hypothetical protein [Roseibium aquae]